MAVNTELENAVLQAWYSYHHKQAIADARAKGVKANFLSPEDSIRLMRSRATLDINTPYKVRFRLGKHLAYGYDFTQQDPESDQKGSERYMRAVETTRRGILGDMGERLLANGVTGDRFGWYLTLL